MRQISVCVYKIEELSQASRDKAVEELSDINFYHGWWENVYEDAYQAAKILGIQINPESIKFEIGRPGEGASFSGKYAYEKGCESRISEEFPTDEKLKRIASNLVAAQRPLRYKGEASIYSCHRLGFVVKGDSDGIEEAIREFNHWLFLNLTQEYEHLSSREEIISAIQVRGLEFNEDGSLWRH